MRRFLDEGKTDREAGTGPRSAFDLHRPPMGGDDGLDEGKAQPRPPGIPAPGRIQTHEGVEDPTGLRGVDADARVLHHDVGLAVAGEQRQTHLAPRRRVLYGVVHQVLEGTAETARLAEDGHGLDLLGAHVNPRALGAAGAALESLEHQRLEIDALARDTHWPGGA